jgi:flagellar hook-associated protein 3 FlgL
MRISTNMIYDTGIAGIQQRLQSQVQLQQQVSSGLRVMKPSDDPVAAAQILNLQQAQSINDQYTANSSTAQGQLGLEDSALSDLTTVLQNVKTQAVYAGNGVLSNADRANLATQLQQSYQQLLSIANRTDSNGQYLFSGYQGATAPFSESSPGTVAYAGDTGQRQVQIGAGAAISVSDSGEAVFRAIKNGNGTFAAAAGAGNTGGGVIGPGNVIDPAKWNAAANAKDFTIKFNVNNGVTPPVTTYDIVDNVNNVSLLTGAAPGAGPYLRTYVPGGTINLKTQSPPDTNATPFDFGAAVSVNGPPASGDSFTVKASTNQDIFSTLQGLITTLQTGSGGGASNASYQNGLNAALSGIDNALNAVLTVRASAGAREQQVTAAQSTAQNLSIQYKQSASGLQDLDLAKAISDLNQQQVSLQAAEQSFVKVTSLNLFSLL